MSFEFNESLREAWYQTNDGWQTTLPEGWMQGRSIFGGLTAAAGVALARRQVDADRRLRQISVNLVRPVASGGLEGVPRVVREGKNTTFVDVRLLQEGTEVANLTVLFMRPRETGMRVPGPRWDYEVGPDGLQDLPYVPGVAPEFVQNVHMRWVKGGFPFSGQAEPVLAGYCGFRVPTGGEEGLVGLMDIWPNPALCTLTTPVPASTVTWTAHLIGIPETFDGLFGFEYDLVAAKDGFHTVVGRLFAPSGELVGWTEQVSVIFD